MTVGALETGLYRLFRFNPCVAVHELRMRMRGGRAFVVFFVYILMAIIPVVLTLAMTAWQGSMFGPGMGMGMSQTGLGRAAFAALAYAQLSLILFVLPAYAAGAITMEREKRTLEMLRATLLSPSDVVTGKLGVVVAFGAILLMTSLPVAAWCLLLGGVALTDLFYVYTYLLAVAVWVAALGLFLSTLVRRSIGAIVATYVILLVWCVGLPIVFFIVMEMMMWSQWDSTDPIGYPGAVALVAAFGALYAWLVFLAFRWLWRKLFRRTARWVGTVVVALATLLLTALFAIGAGSILIHPIGQYVPWATVSLVNPYAGLSFILYAESAEDFFAMARGTTTMSIAGLQTYVWVIGTGLFVLMGVALWVRSIGLFRKRS